MTEIEKKLAELNGTTDSLYENEVNRLIRKKYSLSNELAILRKRDESPDEFAEYTTYAEECKKAVKAELASFEN